MFCCEKCKKRDKLFVLVAGNNWVMDMLWGGKYLCYPCVSELAGGTNRVRLLK